MDKNVLALYVGYEKGIDEVDVTNYEKQWSSPDNEYFLIINYINKDIILDHKFTMIEQYITPYMFYREWEQEYLRKFKIDKLMKRLKNEHGLQNTVS